MKLAVSGISRRFEGVAAVSDVTLECASGEIVGLIGPDGAGRTTRLNLISPQPAAARADDDASAARSAWWISSTTRAGCPAGAS